MILQALVKRYEDLLHREEEKVPRLGWGKAKVSFGLNLNKNGEVEGLLALRTAQLVGKKEVMAPRMVEDSCRSLRSARQMLRQISCVTIPVICLEWMKKESPREAGNVSRPARNFIVTFWRR